MRTMTEACKVKGSESQESMKLDLAGQYGYDISAKLCTGEESSASIDACKTLSPSSLSDLDLKIAKRLAGKIGAPSPSPAPPGEGGPVRRPTSHE